jgi:DNA-binding NtrC family response regulator
VPFGHEENDATEDLASRCGSEPGLDAFRCTFISGYIMKKYRKGPSKVASLAAERAERELVLHVLEQTNWNRSRTARRLNICYRGLLNKLKKWEVRQRRAS